MALQHLSFFFSGPNDHIFVNFVDHGAPGLLGFPTTVVCIVITVYPKKYAHGFCFAVLCCGYTLTDFPISIRLTSLALWQSNDCPSTSKATLMNMDKYFMWIHYERLHNHNKANHNKTVCIFLGIYCTSVTVMVNFIFVVVNVRQHMLWAHRGSNVLVSWTSLEIRGVKG